MASSVLTRAVSQEHDPSHSFGLLRTRRARPHDHAAEQRDERAAINRCDHSITSSARASSVGGTSRPRILADHPFGR